MVLAAGEGTRLRPLTLLRPKPLCPVGNVPMLDQALHRLAGLGLSGPAQVAVNASWLADQVVAQVAGRAYVSVEPDRPLGTAGGVARLRDWVDGRAVLVANADAYLAGGSLAPLLAGWDQETVRLLGVPGEPGEVGTFAGFRFAGCSLLPWRWVRALSPAPAELVGTLWRPAEAAGELQVVRYPGCFLDTGTPAGYLAANRHAAGGGNLVAPGAEVAPGSRESVVGAGTVVHGTLTRAVVWPDGYVGPDEQLVDAVRAGHDLTLTAPPEWGAPVTAIC